MISVFGGYKRIEAPGEASYFAGANTGRGFVSSYNDIVSEDELRRVYIIKGGAGSGKSTMMGRIVQAAKAEGISSMRYYCGSDPHSLDCVVIDNKIAVLDGTAPHAVEMKYPGAASEIIDVSRFWDGKKLEEKRGEIIYRSALKSTSYASAYRYLSAAEIIDRERESLVNGIFDREKARKYLIRLMKKLSVKRGDGEENIKYRYSHGITMKGKYFIANTYGDSRAFFVKDHLGCGALFMSLLEEEIKKLGADAVITRMPISNHISSIYIAEHRIVFKAWKDDGDVIINMSRFTDKESAGEIKGRLKLAQKCEESCIDEAQSCLAEAAENHFALEEIYKPAMDFEKMKKNTKRLTDEILSRIL